MNHRTFKNWKSHSFRQNCKFLVIQRSCVAATWTVCATAVTVSPSWSPTSCLSKKVSELAFEVIFFQRALLEKRYQTSTNKIAVHHLYSKFIKLVCFCVDAKAHPWRCEVSPSFSWNIPKTKFSKSNFPPPPKTNKESLTRWHLFKHTSWFTPR